MIGLAYSRLSRDLDPGITMVYQTGIRACIYVLSVNVLHNWSLAEELFSVPKKEKRRVEWVLRPQRAELSVSRMCAIHCTYDCMLTCLQSLGSAMQDTVKSSTSDLPLKILLNDAC